MGKTQTALKYADIHRKEYTAAFWVVADSRENLVSGFAGLARLLALPQKDSEDIASAAAAAKRWLESTGEASGKWLLILDAVEDWAVAREWIPSSDRGNVLITTRLQFTGTFASAIELPKMSVEEGSTFLLKRSKIELPNDEEILAAKTIAEEFGGLPLGLEQAGAYIEEAKLSPGEYLELYRREGKKLRARAGTSADHATITVTFTLAFEQLVEFAKQIVWLASFMAPDAIPEDLLTAGKAPDIEFRDAVADGVRFSLIQRNPTTKTIDIHRLVQEVVKDAMTPELQHDWIERSADSINKEFPEDIQFENWPTCERLLPHARAVAAKIIEHTIESASSARLLNQTGWYLLERHRFIDAELLTRRALEIRERGLEPDHPETAKSLHNLALINKNRGRYKEAEPFYQRALEILEKALGPDHPDTAKALNGLAGLYDSQARDKEAELLYLRALKILEKVLGPDSPGTAFIMNNLAALYHRQERYQEAEPLYRRALGICENVLGPDDPNTATNLCNLASLYGSQGRRQEAEPLELRALDIRERVLGPDNPYTAASLNSLALLYSNHGRLKEAEPLYQRALEIRERVSGPDHPDTALSLNNSAFFYEKQGRPKEAEPLYRRSLQIRERVLGADHPDTINSLNALGFFYSERGRNLEAEHLLQKALSTAERVFGVEHPRTNRTAQIYSQVLQNMGWGHKANKVRNRFKIKP